MIKLTNITRKFGARVALHEVDVAVAAGHSCGVWGRNGSGKTTLLRIACGLLAPDAGTVEVLGRDPGKDWRIRREIGIAEESDPYFPELTISEFLWWIATLRQGSGMNHGGNEAQIKSLARSLSLEDRMNHAIGSLSHGMRRKVGIAAALIGSPRLLILDEPTNGLDVDSIRALCGLLADHQRGGGSALIASHDAIFMRAVCTDIIELQQGKLIRSEPAAESDLLNRVIAYLQSGGPIGK